MVDGHIKRKRCVNSNCSFFHLPGIVTIPVSMYQTITGATVSMTGSDHQHVQVAMTPISAAGATVANINDIVKVAGQSAEVTLEQNSSGS